MFHGARVALEAKWCGCAPLNNAAVQCASLALGIDSRNNLDRYLTRITENILSCHHQHQRRDNCRYLWQPNQQAIPVIRVFDD
jgi:hypothetical protein